MPDSKPPKNGNGRATIIAMITGTVINAVILGGFGVFVYEQLSDTKASTSMLSQAAMDQKEISQQQKMLLQNHIEYLREADRDIKSTVSENKDLIEKVRDILMELSLKCKKR
ncbi:MAG: hypothetical protein KKB31_07595 [Nanoarchaeota archaeon]|nr:hypothetical protein [Nanoarchaeota archaeon]